MEIKKAMKKDLPTLAKLATEVMAPQFKAVGEAYPTAKQVEEGLKEAMDSMEFIVVLEENKNAIGFLHWYYQDNEAFVEDLIIDTKYQKKGYGKALVNFLFLECKRDKISIVSVLLPYGSQGLKFAEKFGLKPTSVEMKKRL